MGLKNVQEEIVAEAANKAEALLAQARKDAKGIIDQAKKEVADYHKDAERHASEMQEAMERKMVAAAKFDTQRLVMNVKEEVMSEVMARARDTFINLKDAERKDFLNSLLSKARKEIDVASIGVNKKDISLVSGTMASIQVNALPIAGGLIAQNKEGTVSVNLSVEELLASAHGEMLVEISGVLFGKA